MTSASDLETYDPELVAEFVAEAEEELVVAEDALIGIDRDGPDPERLGAAFRALHTIKSSSGYFDIEDLTSLVHAQEELLDDLRQGRQEYRPEMGDIMLRVLDAVRGFLNHFKEGTPDFVEEGLGAKLREELRGMGVGCENTSRVEKAVEYLQLAKASLAEVVGLEGVVDKALASLLAWGGEVSDESEGCSSEAAAPSEGELRPSSNADAAASIHESNGIHDEGEAAGRVCRNQTIRVPEARLDEFLEQVGNMVRLRHVIMAIEGMLSRHVDDTGVMAQVHDMTVTFVRESERLQSGIMSLRQVPIGSILRKLPRVARDVARQTGKEVQVELSGEEAEIDKALIDGLESPLFHMLRNAIDHGIEFPSERLAAGKDTSGLVQVKVEDAADMLKITVSDDGKGIRPEFVLRKAIANGLIAGREKLGDAEILDLIFAPGFSTADAVTEVSGRGVGMEVVRKRIEHHGGEVRLESEPGRGTTFHLIVPKSVNTAIAQTLMTRIGESYLAIPMKRVTEVVAIDAAAKTEMIQSLPTGRVLRLREAIVPLVDVGRALQQEDTMLCDEFSVVLAEEGGARIGLVVEEVHDVMDIVSQRVEYMAQRSLPFSEACIFGDGKIAFILDIPSMVEREGVRLGQRTPRVTSKETRVLKNGSTLAGGGYLLYHAGDGCPQAISMDLVFRLESFARESLQCSAGQVCVRYDQEILPLFTPPGRPIDLGDRTSVIVVQGRDRLKGLIVSSILDIEVPEEHVAHPANRSGVEEILVIDNQSVELVDVETLRPLHTSVLAVEAMAMAS